MVLPGWAEVRELRQAHRKPGAALLGKRDLRPAGIDWLELAMGIGAQVVLSRVERAPEELTGHPRHIHPALDLKYIQAVLKAQTGERAPILDGWLHTWSVAEQVNAILEYRPAVAVIKALTPYIEAAVAIGKALRQAGVVTIAVGQHVSHVAYQDFPGWRDAFDVPVLGDPELETPNVIARLRAGESASDLAESHYRALERREPFVVVDPNELPRPEYTREELKCYPFPFPIPSSPPRIWGYLLSAWGCPHRCTHCSGVVRKTYGSMLRTRAPGPLVDEIAYLLDVGAEAIVFEDDTLLCDRRNFLAICAEINRRGLRFRWIAHARPDELDEQRVAAAAEAGAALFKIGVESGSPRVVESLGKCASGRTWLDHVDRAFENLRRHNIGAVALYLVGSPGETREDIELSIRQAIRLRSDYIQIQIYCAYPDSPYFVGLEEAEQNKVEPSSQYHYARPVWSPSLVPPEELLDVQSTFYRRYYLRPRYALRHLRRFWRFYLAPRSALRRAAGIVAWLAGLRRRSPASRSPHG